MVQIRAVGRDREIDGFCPDYSGHDGSSGDDRRREGTESREARRDAAKGIAVDVEDLDRILDD